MTYIMEKQLISPGTAGIAQRISTNKEKDKVSLKVLKRNYLSVCSQNQY